MSGQHQGICVDEVLDCDLDGAESHGVAGFRLVFARLADGFPVVLLRLPDGREADADVLPSQEGLRLLEVLTPPGMVPITAITVFPDGALRVSLAGTDGVSRTYAGRARPAPLRRDNE